MSLHEHIQKDAEEALKSGEKTRLSVLRDIKTSATNELVATKRKPTDTLSDEELLSVIKRLAKQRKDSIEQFRAGNREELAKKEEKELTILEEYLPEMMSKEEIRPIAEKKKAELGITDKSGMGQLIGAIMKETEGRADGKDVSAIVNELLS